MEVSGQPHASAALPPGKNPDTHCTKDFSLKKNLFPLPEFETLTIQLVA